MKQEEFEKFFDKNTLHGINYVIKKDYVNARKAFNNVIGSNKNNDVAKIYLTILDYLEKKSEHLKFKFKILTDINDLVNNPENLSELFINKANSLLKEGKKELALEMYGNAFICNFKNLTPLREAINLFLDLNMPDQAKAGIEEYGAFMQLSSVDEKFKETKYPEAVMFSEYAKLYGDYENKNGDKSEAIKWYNLAREYLKSSYFGKDYKNFKSVPDTRDGRKFEGLFAANNIIKGSNFDKNLYDAWMDELNIKKKDVLEDIEKDSVKKINKKRIAITSVITLTLTAFAIALPIIFAMPLISLVALVVPIISILVANAVARSKNNISNEIKDYKHKNRTLNPVVKQIGFDFASDYKYTKLIKREPNKTGDIDISKR